MLLTIAESTPVGCHAAHEHRRLHTDCGKVYTESHALRATGGKTHSLLLRIERATGDRIEQFKAGRSLHCPLGSVGHVAANQRAVTFAQEAREIRLHHHRLLGHGFSLNAAIVHVVVVGQTHKRLSPEALLHCRIRRNRQTDSHRNILCGNH